MLWFKKKSKKKVGLSAFNNYPIFHSNKKGQGPDKNPTSMGRVRLRELAELQKYNPYIVRYLSVIASIILGREGFILDMKVKNNDGTIDSGSSNKLETNFNKWSKNVSACGRFNLRDLMSTVLDEQLLLGETFIEKLIVDGQLKYLVHRADQIDDSYSDEATRTISGIKYSDHNKPLSYFIKTRDGNREVLAKDIKHLYKPKGLSDFRGITSLAPVINLLEKLDKFTNAVLNQQIINSATSTVYQQIESEEPLNTYDQDENGNIQKNGQGQFEKTLNSEEVLIVPKGFELKHSDIGSVSPSNGDFIADTLKRISSGLLIPYHALTNDLSQSSFSSLKFNSLLEETHFASMQSIYINLFRSICIDYIEHYSLKASGVNLDKYIDGINIQPYSMPALEPLKDAQVNEKDLSLRITSKTKILAKRGHSYEDILKDMEKEKELEAQYGVAPIIEDEPEV